MPDESVLYTRAGCAESARGRAWLSDRGIAFAQRDASVDPAAARELDGTGTFATPLLVAGDAQVLGFRPRELAALLRH